MRHKLLLCLLLMLCLIASQPARASTLTRIDVVAAVSFAARGEGEGQGQWRESSMVTGAGRISGQLQDGTYRHAPLPGQSVTLQMQQGKSASDLAGVTTNARGQFSFVNLATDKTINYALYIRYQGAQYTSNLINLGDKPVQQVNLVVYEATTSSAHIAIVQATILLRPADAHKGEFAVAELYTFSNLDTHTYVGSLAASSAKPNALLFSLPHTARNVSLGAGFNGYTAIQINGGFASDVALAPGNTLLAFTFTVPFTTSDYDFDYAVQYPTVELTLLVPPAIHASANLLNSQGLITADQHPYQLFKGVGLLAQTELHAQLQGLPAATANANAAPTANPMLPWLLLIVLIMALVLAVTWFIYRLARRPRAAIQAQRSVKSRQRALSTENHTVKAHSANGRNGNTSALDAASPDQQALLQALLKLDKTYELGQLSQAVYQEQRATLKAQLRALVKSKEAS